MSEADNNPVDIAAFAAHVQASLTRHITDACVCQIGVPLLNADPHVTTTCIRCHSTWIIKSKTELNFRIDKRYQQ